MSEEDRGLTAQHLDSLEDSAISMESAIRAGIMGLSSEQVKDLGFRSGGMMIPYWNAKGEQVDFFRFRLDEPDGKTKYLQPKGTGSRLYFPPLSRAADAPNDVPVFIVEGEKKALSLQQRIMSRGIVIGLGGVWNWCKKERLGGGPRPLIDDFNQIPLKGRKAYIVYDSDVSTNAQVRKGEAQLARSLRSAGCDVRLCTIPAGPNGEKYGLDDCLREWGDDWEAPLMRIVRKSVLDRVEIPEILDYGSMLNGEFPAIKVILGQTSLPLLNSGGLCYIHSSSGVGKTYFSLQMAHALSTGSNFLGDHPASRPRRVVFLQAELSAGWFQRRIRSLDAAFGSTENLWIMNGQMDLALPAQYGKYEVSLAPLEEIIRNYNADVVFIDPLQGYLDIPENSTDVNREFQRQLSRMRHKYECAVVLTHHDRKTAGGEGMHRMRGSSVLSDWADVVLSLEREMADGEPVPDTLILNWDKARHAEGPRPDQSRLNRMTVGGRAVPWLEMSSDQDFTPREDRNDASL